MNDKQKCFLETLKDMAAVHACDSGEKLLCDSLDRVEYGGEDPADVWDEVVDPGILDWIIDTAHYEAPRGAMEMPDPKPKPVHPFPHTNSRCHRVCDCRLCHWGAANYDVGCPQCLENMQAMVRAYNPFREKENDNVETEHGQKAVPAGSDDDGGGQKD